MRPREALVPGFVVLLLLVGLAAWLASDPTGSVERPSTPLDTPQPRAPGSAQRIPVPPIDRTVTDRAEEPVDLAEWAVLEAAVLAEEPDALPRVRAWVEAHRDVRNAPVELLHARSIAQLLDVRDAARSLRVRRPTP